MSFLTDLLKWKVPRGVCEIALYGADEYVAGVAQDTGQTIPSTAMAGADTGTALQWTQTVYDTTGGQAWNAANPSRLVVPAGMTKAFIVGSVLFPSSGTGARWVRLTTGVAKGHLSNVLFPAAHASIAQPVPICPGEIRVIPGQFLELNALQSSGSSMVLTIGNASNQGGSTFLRAIFKA